MPCINRIRVTNIQYDYGKKQFPDLLLDVSSKDALVLLTNGGGKTLLLQLLMQVVLPNERLQGRRIIELLQNSRYTGHVAVEWLLDSTGAQKEYVCTGFCFSSGADDQFRYFNYLFDYSDDELTLATLPLVTDLGGGRRQPIRYQELRDWFRSEAEYQVQIFDQVHSYQERLRHYHILPEEWKNIRDTNNSEGGVDRFFERCKTTTQLMDNLLIPSVEQVIFRSENKKQELVNAFNEYKLSLLQIPVIKQNIADFAIVQSQAEDVVQVVQTLDTEQRKLSQIQHELVTLARTFEHHIQDATLQTDKLAVQVDDHREQAEELDWKIASYRVFLKQLDYDAAKVEEEQARAKHDEAVERVKEVEDSTNHIYALHHYNRLLKAQGELAEYSARLEALDVAEPELMDQLAEAKKTMAQAWQVENTVLGEQITKMQEHSLELEKLLRQIMDTKEDHQGQLADLHQEQGSLVAWLRSYAKSQQELEELIPEFSKEDPQETQEFYGAKLERLHTNLEELENSVTEAEKKQTGLEERRLELRLAERDLNSTLQKTTTQLESYGQAAENVGSLLAARSIFQLPVLENKESIIPRVREIWERGQQELILAQATLANQEEKWALLQGRDAYLPHPVMLQVKQELAAVGLPVLLGSEWLASHPASQGEREEYLNKHPLLPFCMIVEKGQLHSVRQAARTLRDLPADFPLLFLVRQSLTPEPNGEDGRLHSVLLDQLYTLHSRNFQLYTSPEYFNEFKSRMEGQLAQEKQQLQALKERAEELSYLKGQVERFYREYSLDLVKTWRNEEDGLNQTLEHNQVQLKELDAEQITLTAKVKQAKQEIGLLNTEKRQLEKYLELLAEFSALHQEYAEQRGKQEFLTREIGLMKRQIDRWDGETAELHAKKAEAAKDLEVRQEALERHVRDFTSYGLETANESEFDGAYEQIRGQVDGILQKLSGGQSDRRDLEDLCRRARGEAEGERLAITKRKISLAWLHEKQRTVTQGELAKADEQLENAQSLVTASKETWWTAQGNVQACLGVVTTLKEGVVSAFGKDPYLSYDSVTHQEELERHTKRLKQVQGTLNELLEKEEELRIWKKENQEAYDQVLEGHRELVQAKWQQVAPLALADWSNLGLTPRVALRQIEERRHESSRRVETGKLKVAQAFHRYGEELEKTNNTRVRQFVREIQSIVSEGRLYDFDFVETQFIRIFEAIEAYRIQYEKLLIESEQNFTHLVNLCMRRALTVYESILEIPKNSRIGLYGRSLQLLNMEWPTNSDEENQARMEQYLHDVIGKMQTWQQEGMDDDDLDSRLGDLLRTRSLLNVLAPIESCRVQVYKPRSESIIRNQRIHHAPWDDVSRWSGGENYSAYITVFMVMLAHIRRQMEGQPNSWKVLVADNPFGKASAGHVLDPIFEVARANQIQLLCFTAHKEESILRYFPVVYSLQLRQTYGKEIMQAEQLESGFYQREETAVLVTEAAATQGE